MTNDDFQFNILHFYFKIKVQFFKETIEKFYFNSNIIFI